MWLWGRKCRGKKDEQPPASSSKLLSCVQHHMKPHPWASFIAKSFFCFSFFLVSQNPAVDDISSILGIGAQFNQIYFTGGMDDGNPLGRSQPKLYLRVRFQHSISCSKFGLLLPDSPPSSHTFLPSLHILASCLAWHWCQNNQKMNQAQGADLARNLTCQKVVCFLRSLFSGLDCCTSPSHAREGARTFSWWHKQRREATLPF